MDEQYYLKNKTQQPVLRGEAEADNKSEGEFTYNYIMMDGSLILPEYIVHLYKDQNQKGLCEVC